VLTDAAPGTGIPDEPGAEHAIHDLVQGLAAYLQEISDYGTVCRRHEGTATVCERGGTLRVIRSFQPGSQAVTHLFETVELLPRWRWGAPRTNGEAAGALTGRAQDGPGPRLPGRWDLAWEGRRVLVEAGAHPPAFHIEIEVCLFSREGELPELPLRALATALRCHEFLVPDGVAPALPRHPEPEREDCDISEYLLRAMPPKLIASQCIPPAGAEH
jgi:hypothetical protein